MALKVGLELTPAITACNVVLILIMNPVYACLVRAMPVPMVLPCVYAALAGVLLLFGVLFTLQPDSQQLAFVFAVFTGTFSLFLTTTFWARMASLHARSRRSASTVSSRLECRSASSLPLLRLGRSLPFCSNESSSSLPSSSSGPVLGPPAKQRAHALIIVMDESTTPLRDR